VDLVAPLGDPLFSRSRAHGAEAQLATLLRTIGFCTGRQVAVDVGAHIGTWAFELAKRFHRVYAFEPQPENFECLKENVGTRAVLSTAALGSSPGRCGIKQHGANSGCWALAPGDEVPVCMLDEYDLSNVDLLKIDVEGNEGDVLLGARSTLKRSHPVVIFEDNGLGPKLYGDAWVDPKPVLRELGYLPRKRIHKDEIWTV
jgi:FkbM family methyltransferase